MVANNSGKNVCAGDKINLTPVCEQEDGQFCRHPLLSLMGTKMLKIVDNFGQILVMTPL